MTWSAYKALGALPSQDTLIMERFFDESGGMQLVIHSPFGIRVNRAWGLALRKRFCRSFNFELQAAATDDAIVISPGTLVRQTIEDCLTEAMDIDGLIALLRRIETGQVRCLARDLPEPSPMAHEILNAKPYAFLDNAPLEERRTQAVLTRRAGGSSADAGMGILDAVAIEKVCEEARPRATNADELHEALLLAGMLAEKEVASLGTETAAWLGALASERRAGRLDFPGTYWIAAERLTLIRAIYPESQVEPALAPFEPQQHWEGENALQELVRGRLEISGPITKSSLTEFFKLSPSE